MRNRTGWPVRVTVGLVGMGLLVAAPGPVPAIGAPAGISPTAGATVSAVSVAGVEYRLIDLGTLGGEPPGVSDVNERGQVAGNADTASGEMHAFLWDPVTGMTDLGTLGGADSAAFAVNNRGQAVGWSLTESSATAFLWDRVTGMIDLGALDGIVTMAYAVNDRGQVVGFADEWHAFLWDPVTGMTDLGGESAQAFAVNEGGQVAGRTETWSGERHAILWDPATGMNDLGTLGGEESGAWAVNERGQVAGVADTASGLRHAFLWDPATGMTDLGTLGGNESGAGCVNERGQVAGNADTASGQTHAFLWDPATGMSDLGTLGGNESFSDCVNERGQVAGVADTASGERHAFLWDPVSGMTDLGTLDGDVTGISGPNEQGQVAGMSGGRAVLWTPVTLAPQVRVRVAQARYGNKLRVNVNPNRIGDAWKFRVQKRTAGVWTTLPTVYWTRGTAETRTLTLGPGRYRVKVANRYGYTGTTSTAVRLTRKTARVHLGTDSARTRLRVNVDPNKGAGYWAFRVQRQRTDGTWRTLPRTYTTRGNRETRTLNLNKGTYRVKVQAKYGYRGTTSTAVQLRA